MADAWSLDRILGTPGPDLQVEILSRRRLSEGKTESCIFGLSEVFEPSQTLYSFRLRQLRASSSHLRQWTHVPRLKQIQELISGEKPGTMHSNPFLSPLKFAIEFNALIFLWIILKTPGVGQGVRRWPACPPKPCQRRGQK
jgi:hypothetical protein